MAPRKSPSLLTLVASALIGAAIAFGGYLLGKSAHQDPVVRGWIDQVGASLTLWDLLAVPVLILVVLGVHEIGHLLGGMVRGMRFLLLIVGPFQWRASANGLRFQWVRNLGLMGGLAATVPTRLGPGLQQQLATMIAGGPMASLLLAGGAVALMTAADGRVAAYAGFIALASTGIFLVTAIPLRTGGFMSDGLQLVDLLRGGRSVAERSLLLQLTAQSLAGVRPREWESTAVENLAALDSLEPMRRIAGWVLLLYRAMDCRESTRIAHYRVLLAEHVEAFPDGFRQSIHVELALLAALDGDAPTAQLQLSKANGGVVDRSRRHLAQAALARLEGRADDAARERALAGKHLHGALDAGLARLTEEQLAKIA